ncbi:hypothetical protein [Streptomyces sp. GS7]|uniref:hypothetical protein n=1 Tax=Streptomyces sp. GS7 TaxID=2692234 RepID=UPI00131744B4|nr:hypothetical protein [Streptomyces sp. GS7]QHC22645.1 hypothetical protein GR130_15605 [Streptomyces sp. GS7]
MEEVAALVELLKRSGEDPNPGDEVLRAAAMTRPVSELGPLLAMLGEAPHTAESSYEALRAAAVNRSVDEVVQLIRLFDSAREAHFPVEGPPGGDNFPDGHHFAESHADTMGQATSGMPMVNDPVLEPYPDPYGHPADNGYPNQAPHTAGPHEPAMHDGLHRDAPPWPQNSPWPANTPQGGAGWPTAGAPPQPGQAVGGMLRSALRWPAAAALALCGLSHLPLGLSEVHNGPSDGISMAIAAVYLLLAGWLAMRDTAAIWTASATAAVTVIVLHALTRAGVLAPLSSSLGDAGMWPELLAVGLAILSAGLAGAALLLRPRRVSPVTAGA